MLRKKHVVKGKQALSAKDYKAVRNQVASRYFSDFNEDASNDLTDGFLPRKAQVVVVKWMIGERCPVSLIVVDGVALLFSVDGHPEEDAPYQREQGNARCGSSMYVVPTLFGLLKLRYLSFQLPSDSSSGTGGEPDANFVRILKRMGHLVLSYSQTSKHVVSGAHMMVPGIVSTIAGTGNGAGEGHALTEGDSGLLMVIGCIIPYAVGVITPEYVNKETSGRGLFVYHAYDDKLWQEYSAAYQENMMKTVKKGENDYIIPSNFKDGEVRPGDFATFCRTLGIQTSADDTLAQGSAEECGEEGAGTGVAENACPDDMNAEGTQPTTESNANPSEEQAEGANLEGVSPDPDTAAAADAGGDDDGADFDADTVRERAKALFEGDGVYHFALCETVKKISPSMLPMPITDFVGSHLVHNYPRGMDPEISAPINFKKSKFKKALAFLRTCEDTVILREAAKEVYHVEKVIKNSKLMKEHNKNYSDFLNFVHNELVENERFLAEKEALSSAKASKSAVKTKITSVEEVYRPRKTASYEVLKAVCLGIFPPAPSTSEERFPELNAETFDQKSTQKVSSAVDAAGVADYDDDLFYEEFSLKTIGDNVRQYIRHAGILLIAKDQAGGSSGEPSVQIDDFLRKAWSTSEVPPTTTTISALIGILVKRLFSPFHEIILQTTWGQGSTASSTMCSVERRKTAHGHLPSVYMWTEKRGGNKIVTVLSNLAAFGFDLESVLRQWKHQFNTSCTVVDPTKNYSNLKNGTKMPLQIHLQGDLVQTLDKLLPTDLGVPRSLIAHTRL